MIIFLLVKLSYANTFDNILWMPKSNEEKKMIKKENENKRKLSAF